MMNDHKFSLNNRKETIFSKEKESRIATAMKCKWIENSEINNRGNDNKVECFSQRSHPLSLGIRIVLTWPRGVLCTLAFGN